MWNISSTPITIFGQDFTETSFIKQQYVVPMATAIPMMILEKVLWDDAWQKKFEKPSNRALYFSAIRANLLNYGGLHVYLCSGLFV